MRRRTRLAIALMMTLVVLGGTHGVFTQTATTALSGTVVDETGAVIQGVLVRVTNSGTGLVRELTTNTDGYFTAPLLPPGKYHVQTQHDGFAPGEVRDVDLHVNDHMVIKLVLKLAAIGEVVTVAAAEAPVRVVPSVGTIIPRALVDTMPLNGRTFQSLIMLTPGVVVTNAFGGDQGQFSVNGQRANANNFIIDGVSANFSVGFGALLQGGVGSLPALAPSGGTNNLVSVDALEEFNIQTSSYAPEFGRTPGAQVSILTRSGTNEYNGSVFEYFRHADLDANDWFANSLGLAKPQLRQHNFGGVFGGPVFRNRTFFFASYEGQRLREPRVNTNEVPTLASRQAAAPQHRPYFNAFPLPNGPETGGGFARHSASYTNPSELDSTSVRVDHRFKGRLQIFGRYSYAPASLTPRLAGVTSASALSTSRESTTRTQTFTSGVTATVRSNVMNELRVNWSRHQAAIRFLLDDFDGAIVPSVSEVFPPFANPETARINFSFAGGRGLWYIGKNATNVQRQLNLVDTLSIVTGRHMFKLGVDYRYLTPTNGLVEYSQAITGTLAGLATSYGISANDEVSIGLSNFSAFAQDDWRISPRATITYGLRMDVNTPPNGLDGKELYTVTTIDPVSSAALAPAGTPLWETQYSNLAPRVGLSYRLSDRPGWQQVLRGGYGVFFDMGTGNAANSASGFPHSRSITLANVPFPILDPVAAAPRPFSLTPPHPGITYAYPADFALPYTHQFNVALEQALGRAQTVTITYVGARGRRLLRAESVSAPNPNFQFLSMMTNLGESEYDALQLQYQRRLSGGLQANASYTLSRCWDNTSSEAESFQSATRLDPGLDWGPCSYDVRHSTSGAVSYDLPSPSSRTAAAIFGGWSLDSFFFARSGTPFHVSVVRDIGFGSFSARPDLVPGASPWVEDGTAPGGKRLDRTAFVVPTELRQGNLPRNSIYGFAAWQLDMALRRTIPLGGKRRVQLRAEFFNVLNNPNFAQPNTTLTSGLFGVSAQMLGRSLGNVGASGLNPLYQIGGPRSAQLVARLMF